MNSSDVERRIAKIEKRNARVEQDKQWEVSLARRLTIAVITYVSVSVFLIVIKKAQPFINAFVPVIGYLLSTLVLPQVRKIWQQNRT